MQEFIIKKGKHRSSFRLSRLCIHFRKKRFKWNFSFSKSCQEYADDGLTNATPMQSQINKLCGVSFGEHHKNSIRIGWRAERSTRYNFIDTGKRQISLFAYWYADGIRKERKITTIDVEKTYSATICVYKEYFLIEIFKVLSDGNKIQIHLHHESTKENTINMSFFGYYLFPYFGGTVPAPNNMKIMLERVQVK